MLCRRSRSCPRLRSIFNEGEYEQELHKDAEAHLAQIAADLSRKGVTVTSQVGTANEVGMEILRIAEHVHADLIVIATHGMTGWHRLAFGSVAEKVVRLATFPVLVLRAQVEAKALEVYQDSEVQSKRRTPQHRALGKLLILADAIGF